MEGQVIHENSEIVASAIVVFASAIVVFASVTGVFASVTGVFAERMIITYLVQSISILCE